MPLRNKGNITKIYCYQDGKHTGTVSVKHKEAGEKKTQAIAIYYNTNNGGEVCIRII